MRRDEGSGGHDPDPARDPSAAVTPAVLDELKERLAVIAGDSDLKPEARARGMAAVERDLLAALPQIGKLDPTFGGIQGHPTLADTSHWRDAVESRDLAESADAIESLVEDLVSDEVTHWRHRAERAIDAGDANACFRSLADARVLEREALDRRRSHTRIARITEGRAPVRAAMEQALERKPASTGRLHEWAVELLDRADVVLTSIDHLPPARASVHLEVIAEDIDWHIHHVERKGSRRRSRLKRKLARIRNELQERELQGKLEARYGAKRVVLLERMILWLIFFVLAALTAELMFDLSVDLRIRLAIADTFACVVFLMEFFLKLSLVRGKARWFARHFIVDFLPSLPVGIFVLGELGADPSRAGRALRLLRLPRLARYVRFLLPLIRMVRAFGFLARGMDRMVRRYGHLLNRNIVLYPNRAERAQAERQHLGPVVRARRLRSELNAEWRELLRSAPRAERPLVASTRLEALRWAREQGHTARAHDTAPPPSAVPDIPAEVFLATLAGMNQQQLEAELGPDFITRAARAIRIFSLPPIRWFPIVRRYVPRLVPRMSPADVVTAACHQTAKEFKRHHDRWFWCADLYGTVTPSEFVDRIGTTMVKSSFRPAYRLVVFGIVYLLLTLAFSQWVPERLDPAHLGRDLTTFEVIYKFFETVVGGTLKLLGSICFIILAIGWWLRRVAGEATFFYEETAKAQFLALTETFKGRHLSRDIRTLDRRILDPEDRLIGNGSESARAERRAVFESAVRSWMVEAQVDSARGDALEAMERVILLYRDSLDGALFGDSDTRTTSQLLGNPALRQLRVMSKRISKKERKELRALDLDRQRLSIRGPYLWFNYISKAVAQAAARLIVEYNRHAIPLAELPFASEEAKERYERWVASGKQLPDDAERERAMHQNADYVTTAFTALHFLDDDPLRDREIADRFGLAVLRNLREDRHLLFRKIFGTYPLHTRPKEQRVVNLFRVYHSWFAGGRAFFLPLRVMWRGVKMVGRFLRWLGRAVSEIRRPKTRRGSDVAAEADFATAVRKIDRMRGPVVWACLWMRARFDCEYLGVRVPGSRRWGLDGTGVENDLRFLGAGEEEARRIEEERERAEADMRRFSRMIDDGLMEDVARHIGVAPDALGEEHARAAAAAYRADFQHVRPLLSCETILEETRDEALERPTRHFMWFPKPLLWMRFRRWWEVHGDPERPEARKAMWRAVRHNHGESAVALRIWTQMGPAQARAQGVEALAEQLRHAARLSEQLVTLRAVQTLSLIDLLNYREHVYRLGEYEASGDVPGEWLTLDEEDDANAEMTGVA